MGLLAAVAVADRAGGQVGRLLGRGRVVNVKYIESTNQTYRIHWIASSSSFCPIQATSVSTIIVTINVNVHVIHDLDEASPWLTRQRQHDITRFERICSHAMSKIIVIIIITSMIIIIIIIITIIIITFIITQRRAEVPWICRLERCGGTPTNYLTIDFLVRVQIRPELLRKSE